MYKLCLKKNNKGSHFIKSYSTCLKRSSEYSKGLTFVELMVVISIFTIITSVVIVNYGGFKSNVSMQNLTDDIALSIRKAQSFAIGARGIGGSFSSSYGMHFSANPNKPSNLIAYNKSFLMFSTSSLDKRYVPTSGNCGDASNSCIELFNIIRTDNIKDIILSDGTSLFTSGGYLDIVFTRPDPKAYFCYRSSIGSSCDSSSTSKVDIIISNGETDETKYKTKTISIQNTGQISIQ